MRITNYILVVVLTALLAGCKKNELPEPVKEDPKLWLKFNLNGLPCEFKAGEGPTTASATSLVFNSKRDFIFTMHAPELKKEMEITIFNVPQNVINQFDNIESELDRTIVPGRYKYCHNDGSVYWQPKQGELAIKYTDDNYNETYETEPAHQPPFSEFEIISVTDTYYKGEPYKLAEIKFSCLLKCHTTGGYYKISNGKGVIVFGQ